MIKVEQKLTIAQKLRSPCVRNCCLDSDDICLGCFRCLDEILHWQSYNAEQRLKVLGQCQQREKLNKTV